MTPFQAVFDRLTEILPLSINPGKTMQAVRLIQEWLDTGCDAELDILPAINHAWAWGKSITSPAYFDKPVRAAREKRVGSAELDRKKYQRIRWLEERLPGMVDGQMRAWKAKYETSKGDKQ